MSLPQRVNAVSDRGRYLPFVGTMFQVAAAIAEEKAMQNAIEDGRDEGAEVMIDDIWSI